MFLRLMSESGGTPSALSPNLTALVDSYSEAPAPATIRDLATSRSGRSTYAMHRLASSRVHAGALLGRRPLEDPAEDFDGNLEAVAHMCVAWADACLRALDGATT